MGRRSWTPLDSLRKWLREFHNERGRKFAYDFTMMHGNDVVAICEMLLRCRTKSDLDAIKADAINMVELSRRRDGVFAVLFHKQCERWANECEIDFDKEQFFENVSRGEVEALRLGNPFCLVRLLTQCRCRESFTVCKQLEDFLNDSDENENDSENESDEQLPPEDKDKKEDVLKEAYIRVAKLPDKLQLKCRRKAVLYELLWQRYSQSDDATEDFVSIQDAHDAWDQAGVGLQEHEYFDEDKVQDLDQIKFDFVKEIVEFDDTFDAWKKGIYYDPMIENVPLTYWKMSPAYYSERFFARNFHDTFYQHKNAFERMINCMCMFQKKEIPPTDPSVPFQEPEPDASNVFVRFTQRVVAEEYVINELFKDYEEKLKSKRARILLDTESCA